MPAVFSHSRRALFQSRLLRGIGPLACVGLLLGSCSRSQTVPPISSTPELRIPVVTSPVTTSPTPVEATPIKWSRSPWTPETTTRGWKSIVIHHTATDAGSVESIHQTHLARKDADGNPWRGIGYHFVIGNGHGMEDGAVEPTFRWRDQIEGAHAGNAHYNHTGIGICLIGNFQEQPPTDAQLSALTTLIQTLSAQYAILSSNVKRHGDVNATACPGRFFPMQELTQTLSRSE